MRSILRPVKSISRIDRPQNRHVAFGPAEPTAAQDEMDTGTGIQASVTIYLSLAFACVAALIFSLAEISRTAGSKYYLQVASDSAIDSLFSEYDIEIWNQYRLLLLNSDRIDAVMKLESYAKPYAVASNWFHMSEPEADVGDMVHITDSGGIWLEQEILDYMKYGIVEQLFTSDADVQKLWDDLKDAATVKKITNEYAGQTREAIALEKVLMQISENIDSQEKLKKEAYRAIHEGDTSTYHRKARELRTLCQKMPNLVRNYTQKADKLGKKLDEIGARYQAQIDELSSDSAGILQNSVDDYRQYTDADSERRQEIEAQTAIARRNIEILDETEERIDEAEEEIAEGGDTYEYEDEFGNVYTETEEVDEGPIWAAVADYFDSYVIKKLNCRRGLADEEKEGFLESAKDILSGNLLQLVIPEGRRVSEHTVDDLVLVSTGAKSRRDETETGIRRTLLDNIMMCEYTAQFFTDFTDDQDRNLQYEMEYIANGKRSDKDNLSASLSRIFAIREGMNYLTILKSSNLSSKADKLATTIVGAAGMPALKPLIKCLIIGVWAGAETVTDLRAMLKGGRVTLIKTEDEWKTSLEQVLATGSKGELESDEEGDSKGQSYEDYLKFLILQEDLTERDYRMMDVIQINVRMADGDYYIENAVYGLEATFYCECPRLFTMLGINHPDETARSYSMTAWTQKEY